MSVFLGPSSQNKQMCVYIPPLIFPEKSKISIHLRTMSLFFVMNKDTEIFKSGYKISYILFILMIIHHQYIILGHKIILLNELNTQSIFYYLYIWKQKQSSLHPF